MATDPLPYLDTFVRVAEMGSFTAAGRAAGLSQAAVSQRIHAIEKILGVSLFDRRGGHVQLTEAGRKLHGYAEQILTLHDQARAEITGRRPPLSGELVLAASSIPGEHFLPGYLAEFRARHPHVQLKVSVTDSEEVLQKVERGQAHLGLIGARPDSPHFEFRCFAGDRLVLVVPADHAWKRRRSVSVKQMIAQPLIVREPGSGSRRRLEEAVAQGGRLNKLRIAFELGNNEAILESVRRGLGLAIVSDLAARKDADAGWVHVVQVSGIDLQREMFAVWDRRRVLPIPARLFLDLLPPCSEAAERQ